MLKGFFIILIIFSSSHGQEEYFCRKKTSKVKIRGANTQDFVFNTNTNGGKRYKGSVDCTAEYIYKKCKKLNIMCPAFDLKNKRDCNKGDYLEVNGEKFCHKNGPSITAEKKLRLRFVSDKKGTASGARCLISCLDETQTTTTTAATTVTGAETKSAILIAGGVSTEEELWIPDDDTICGIPSLPRGSYHGTLDGMKYCRPYGGNYGNETECVGFDQGIWDRSNSGFKNRRSFHTSWETEDGIYLMGGEGSYQTSEFARNDGTVTEGFSLRYPIRLSCSISDGDSVVVTGGHFSKGNVVRYNVKGFVEDLPDLITGRFSHACSWYINSQDKMVYLVAGGVSGASSRFDNAEVLVKGDSAWREVTARLPVGAVSSLSGVNLNNKVYLIGGSTFTEDHKYKTFDNIMEFQTDSETWETVAKLRNPRGGHGSSVVKVEDFKDYVIDCISTTTSTASTTTTSTAATTSASSSAFAASLTVVNASSVYADHYEKYGPEQALTPVSLDGKNYWHSGSDDDNPSITFKMQHEHEVLSVEVVDRQDCCNERFQSVEVRVGSSPSFDDAVSCGIQSDEGKKRYKYFCPSVSGQFVMIKKVAEASSSWMKPLHVNHVTVFTKEQDQGCTCGVANVPNNRIVGGSEAGQHQYPWMIRLVAGGYCGGTLISKQHVLTAAHCVVSEGKIRPLSIFSVDLGEHDYFNTSATRVSISEIIPYPKYMIDDNGNSTGKHVSHYDIAVLKLSSPVTFSRNIAPVCLPAHTMGNHAGKDAVVTGWGWFGEDTGGSPVLKQANVTIQTNKDCNKAYGTTDRFISTQICAGTPEGEPNRAVRFGDSGGPLHVKEHGRYTQVGVVSGTDSSFKPEIPDVYIRTGEESINKWIKDVTTGTQDSNCR